MMPTIIRGQTIPRRYNGRKVKIRTNSTPPNVAAVAADMRVAFQAGNPPL